MPSSLFFHRRRVTVLSGKAFVHRSPTCRFHASRSHLIDGIKRVSRETNIEVEVNPKEQGAITERCTRQTIIGLICWAMSFCNNRLVLLGIGFPHVWKCMLEQLTAAEKRAGSGEQHLREPTSSIRPGQPHANSVRSPPLPMMSRMHSVGSSDCQLMNTCRPTSEAYRKVGQTTALCSPPRRVHCVCTALHEACCAYNALPEMKPRFIKTICGTETGTEARLSETVWSNKTQVHQWRVG